MKPRTAPLFNDEHINLWTQLLLLCDVCVCGGAPVKSAGGRMKHLLLLLLLEVHIDLFASSQLVPRSLRIVLSCF